MSCTPRSRVQCLPSADFDATPNLLVLQSLSKTAGLASLRIGFAIGHPGVIDRVGRVTGPYDINSVAVAAAFAALADQSYVDAYVAEVLRARDWTVETLREAGVRHHRDGGNYLLIKPKRLWRRSMPICGRQGSWCAPWQASR